jgi:ABC-2 type transport system ATP-binding protein
MIKDLLKTKAREGMTIFLTTHILALIEDMADRIGIIVHGHLVAIGTFEQLATQCSIQGGRLEDVFFSLATP